MSDTGTNVGGWPATSMRTYLNGDFYNLLSDDLKNNIIDTTVVSGHGSSESNNFTTTDKIYLLAPKEIYNDFANIFESSKDLSRQLDYYKYNSIANYSDFVALKKYGDTNDYWWHRTATTDNNTSFFLTYETGEWGYIDNTVEFGVSPAFRIG